MNRFMIGQYGCYDQKKHLRDFRDGFYGVEACLLGDEDIKKLLHTAKSEKFCLGIHFPLRAQRWKYRDPQFLSKDKHIKRSSYKNMSEEINFLKGVRPKYILFHYPKPVLLDKSVDWTNWRFADNTEFCFDEDYSYQELINNSEELFLWLTEISIQNHFTPVLEFDALNKYIYGSDFLEVLLNEYSEIRICLDIGRLHLQDKIDKSFDSFAFTKRFAKYAEVIHLWNVKVTSNLEKSHFPVLPNLSPKEGWADVEKYLEIINQENKSCKILFEHRSDLISDAELDTCYNWIKMILSDGCY